VGSNPTRPTLGDARHRRTQPEVEEHPVTVFALMDEWIAATGRTDEWLQLGLDVLEQWQGLDAQQHVAAVLTALAEARPTRPPAPDRVALAVWFHHAGPAAAYAALAPVGGPLLGQEVARLVRVLAGPAPHADDRLGALLLAAHRSAKAATPLAAVRPVTRDQ
jgi:hypothetical protein